MGIIPKDRALLCPPPPSKQYPRKSGLKVDASVPLFRGYRGDDRVGLYISSEMRLMLSWTIGEQVAIYFDPDQNRFYFTTTYDPNDQDSRLYTISYRGSKGRPWGAQIEFADFTGRFKGKTNLTVPCFEIDREECTLAVTVKER